MPYWNEIITQKSWRALQELKRGGLKFVLIGGWAVWLYTRAQKSKDVDIIVGFNELSRLKGLFSLKKNLRLKRYEFQINGIDVDVYVKFFSKLALPVEEAVKETKKIGSFTTVKPEVLLILKQGAEADRKASEKGFKDRLDILNLLLNTGIDFKEYNSITKKHKIQHYRRRLIEIVQNFHEGKCLGLNPRQLKKEKQSLLKKIKKAT